MKACIDRRASTATARRACPCMSVTARRCEAGLQRHDLRYDRGQPPAHTAAACRRCRRGSRSSGSRSASVIAACSHPRSSRRRPTRSPPPGSRCRRKCATPTRPKLSRAPGDHRHEQPPHVRRVFRSAPARGAALMVSRAGYCPNSAASTARHSSRDAARSHRRCASRSAPQGCSPCAATPCAART